MDTPAAFPTGLRLSIQSRIADIPAAAWDALHSGDNPFISHRFLRLLEDSGSVGGDTGWLPQHLTIHHHQGHDPDGHLVGAAPLYVKSHSMGEYVFDQGWAQAYERAGGRYYPKLQIAVPFTPVTGPRLLVRPGHAAADAVRQRLIMALEQAVRSNGLSSAHVTFATRQDHDALAAAGWLSRLDRQYHWENRGYARFEDFLADLASRKRKAIIKERKAVADSGLEVLTLTGGDLREEHWDAFFRLYNATSDRKWGWAYLTRDFFHGLAAEMADQVVLVMGRDPARSGPDQWVGGAFNMRGGDTLYGRNWGSAGDYPYLHFEACYYRAIDFAIAHGLRRVEAGAQGEHKIQRGYLPTPTRSAHFIADPGLRRAVGDFLERERAAVTAQTLALADESPYRRAGD